MASESNILSNGDLASLCFLLTAILFNVKRHIQTPRMAFSHKWAMRTTGALCFSFLHNILSNSTRPLWMLFTTCILVFFLLESIRIWHLTGLLTTMEIPLFPRFQPCENQFVWPIGKFFDQQRTSILKEEFEQSTLLKVGNNGAACMFSPIFYSKDSLIRLQIMFDISSTKRPFLNCILTSFLGSGEAIITTNMQTLFVSFYPKTWQITRTSTASLKKLIELHKKQIANKTLTEFQRENTIDSLNTEQFNIESENCRDGLCERSNNSSNSIMTFAGRYKLWCDMLSYSYLGTTIKH